MSEELFERLVSAYFEQIGEKKITGYEALRIITELKQKYKS